MKYTNVPIFKLSNEIIYMIINNIKIKVLMELKSTCKYLKLIISKNNISNINNKINIYINVDENNELKIIKGEIINNNINNYKENYIVFVKKNNELNKILKLGIFNNEYVKDIKIIFTSIKFNNKIIFSRYYEYLLNENIFIMDFIKKDNLDNNKFLEIKNDILDFLKKHNKIQNVQYNGYTDSEIYEIINFIIEYNVIPKSIKWNDNINLRILNKLIKNNNNIIITLKNNSRNRNYKEKYKDNIEICNKKVILKEIKYVLYIK